MFHLYPSTILKNPQTVLEKIFHYAPNYSGWGGDTFG